MQRWQLAMAVNINKLVDVRIDSASALTATHDVTLGGSNIVRQTFQPTSFSASNLDFVIQTPGLAVYMSRRVNIECEIPFTFTVSNFETQPYGTGLEHPSVSIGKEIGLEAFPFNSLITSATVQISTSSFTTQVQQTLPLIKRRLNDAITRRQLGEVPCGLGSTSTILPAINALSSYPQMAVLAGMSTADGTPGNVSDANAIKITKTAMSTFNSASGQNNQLPDPTPPVVGGGLSNTSKFLVPQANVNTAGFTIPGQTQFYGVINICEPLLIQPFEIDDETPAFINVNLISVRLNFSDLGAALARPLRFACSQFTSERHQTATTGGDASNLPSSAAGNTNPIRQLQRSPYFSNLTWDMTNIGALQNAKLVCTFLSPPPTAAVPMKTIYPTVFYNPLPTSFRSTIPFGKSVQIPSTVITLNTAPDAIAIYFVPTLPDYTNEGDINTGGPVKQFSPSLTGAGYATEDTVLSLDSLSISWNNNPSLLATFDNKELWRRSSQNGLVTSYAAYRGEMINSSSAAYTSNQQAQPGSSFYYYPAQTNDPQFENEAIPVYTKPHGFAAGIGSPTLLMLNKDIPVEPGVAAGVAGVYTLQVTATVRNHLTYDVLGGSLFVVPITSQYLILNAGATSDVLTTVTTEEQVVATPVSGDVQSNRLMGGAAHNKDGSVVASCRTNHGMGRMSRGMHGGDVSSGGGMQHHGHMHGGDVNSGGSYGGRSYLSKRHHSSY